MLTHRVRRTPVPPHLELDLPDPAWEAAESLAVSSFHPDSDAHRPTTQACALFDETHLYVRFEVHDQYVRSTVTDYQGPVSASDSCVEIFLQPHPDRGYVNLECNAGGTLLLGYHDGRRPETARPVPWEWGQQVRVAHSLPRVVDPEIATPVTWHLACAIPFALCEHLCGPVRPLAGSSWRANFYKIAKTSHCHWASWTPLGDLRSFHQPERFGTIVFAHS